MERKLDIEIKYKNMKDSKFYIEHEGKVVEIGSKFEHVMAIALDPFSKHKNGIIRCIVSREGDVTESGYIDRSALYRISGNSLEKFEIGEKLNIENDQRIIDKIKGKAGDFLGLEDPDIWRDENTGFIHIYFTMPIKDKHKDRYNIHLGHAVGKDFDSLEMTKPTLMGSPHRSAKEVSIAPINSKGFRYNLVESSKKGMHFTYSTVRVAIAKDMGKPWKFGDTIFNPEDESISWIGGHASPGPLLPESFINVGDGKRLGILNGREANKKIGKKTIYGMFSVGLFIYDYENGKIDWVSPEPLIIDSEARTITFASQFVETKASEGILYAHVDDSFVRAYTLNGRAIETLLPAVHKK